MKERPILFSGPMVRVILDGRKTMTRIIVLRPHDLSAMVEQIIGEKPCHTQTEMKDLSILGEGTEREEKNLKKPRSQGITEIEKLYAFAGLNCGTNTGKKIMKESELNTLTCGRKYYQRTEADAPAAENQNPCFLKLITLTTTAQSTEGRLERRQRRCVYGLSNTSFRPNFSFCAPIATKERKGMVEHAHTK